MFSCEFCEIWLAISANEIAAKMKNWMLNPFQVVHAQNNEILQIFFSLQKQLYLTHFNPALHLIESTHLFCSMK